VFGVTSTILIIPYFYSKIKRTENFYKNLSFVNNMSVNNVSIYVTIIYKIINLTILL
jgi:hypothetical protein